METELKHFFDDIEKYLKQAKEAGRKKLGGGGAQPRGTGEGRRPRDKSQRLDLRNLQETMMQSLGEIKILCKTVEIVLAEQMDEGFNPISQKLGRVSALIRFLQLRFNLRFQIYNGDGRGQTEELNSHLGISVADCLVAKQELRDAASAVAENSRSEKQLRRRHTTSLGTAEELASTLEGRQDVSEGITESSVSEASYITAKIFRIPRSKIIMDTLQSSLLGSGAGARQVIYTFDTRFAESIKVSTDWTLYQFLSDIADICLQKNRRGMADSGKRRNVFIENSEVDEPFKLQPTLNIMGEATTIALDWVLNRLSIKKALIPEQTHDLVTVGLEEIVLKLVTIARFLDAVDKD